MDKKNDTDAAADKPLEEQAREQVGQRVRLRIDERDLQTTYANFFRTNGTADEVMLDLGLNMLAQPTGEESTPEIIFKINDRVVLNYYSAKRLAIALSQLIRRHEEQFGELELDVSKRAKSKS